MKKLGIVNRPIWVILPFILSVLPLAEPIHTGRASGSGADFITTTWAMWWFQQEWLGAAWGGHSTWFNFPYGGQGAILSPISAFVWSILEPVLGANGATTTTVLFSIWSLLGALLWLGRGAQLSLMSCGALMLAALLPRYFVFTLGETGPVGVAALPMILGFGAWVWRERIGGYALFLILMMGLQGLENPYLAPILPGFFLFSILKKKENLQILLGGVVLLALVGFVYHGSSAKNYESIRPTEFLQIATLYFPAIERPWARALPLDLIVPRQVVWPLGGLDSIHMAGREYLGVCVLLAALSAPLILRAKSRLWLALFLVGLVLATGSSWGGLAAPFAWFNSLCSLLIRPLTQPTRYLVVSMLGGAVLVGLLVERAAQKKELLGGALYVLLLLEALLLGGLSLRIPATLFPDQPCLKALNKQEGGVLIWPWDGMDDVQKDSTLRSRILQLAHGRPGATIGTGSWPLIGEKFPGYWLRNLGWKKAMEEKGELDKSELYRLGYRWVVVDLAAPTMPVIRAQERILGPQNLVDSCEGYEVYRLGQK